MVLANTICSLQLHDGQRVPVLHLQAGGGAGPASQGQPRLANLPASHANNLLSLTRINNELWMLHAAWRMRSCVILLSLLSLVRLMHCSRHRLQPSNRNKCLGPDVSAQLLYRLVLVRDSCQHSRSVHQPNKYVHDSQFSASYRPDGAETFT